MSYIAKRALLFAFVVLVILTTGCIYLDLMTAAKIFGGVTLIPLSILAAIGWTHVWDALDNGKVP